MSLAIYSPTDLGSTLIKVKHLTLLANEKRSSLLQGRS
jgi:hypothetical protein